MGSCLDLWYQVYFYFCGVSLKSSQKVVGYPHNTHTTGALVGISYHVIIGIAKSFMDG